MTTQRADMQTLDALRVLFEARLPDQVVITNQGSAREWPKLEPNPLEPDPLDFHFLPSAMGAAIPFGLGLALAQPTREILVVSGDGSLLMNLGCLVTVTGSGVSNLTVVVLDNGSYAVTGIQKTAAFAGQVDYTALAAACGFQNVAHFDDLTQWSESATVVLARPGPRFISIAVAPEHHQLPPEGLRPIQERLSGLREQLGT